MQGGQQTIGVRGSGSARSGGAKREGRRVNGALALSRARDTRASATFRFLPSPLCGKLQRIMALGVKAFAFFLHLFAVFSFSPSCCREGRRAEREGQVKAFTPKTFTPNVLENSRL